MLCIAILAVACSFASAFSPYTGITSSQHHRAQVVTFATPADTTAESNNVVSNTNQECGVILLDHLNINHEKGRQDALKAFYFDFLGCAIDPRKYENYVAGKKV